MPSLPPLHYFRDEMALYKFIAILLVSYFCIMDIIMYMVFMKTDLVESKPAGAGELYSPFKHLSIKALMNDHSSQYINAPTTEYFDIFTHFSTIFYFITPNMISFFHLFLAFISGRLVSSESLHTRRIGVVLFEFRTWLDALDGVVYRSHSNTKGLYKSVRSSLGYYVDMTCDCIGGVFLMFGVLFYFFKRFAPGRQSDLPWKSPDSGSSVSLHNGGTGGQVTYSKKMLFWKCWCYGFAIALAGKFWDSIVGEMGDIFQTPLHDPAMSALQFEMCHSTTNLIIMWVWRLLEGQALLQYVLVAIFLDKIWEFLNFFQYIAFVVIISLYTLSLLYVRHLRTVLHI